MADHGRHSANSAIAIGGAETLAIAMLPGHNGAAAVLRPTIIVLLAINLAFLVPTAAELRPAMPASRGDGRSTTIVALGGSGGVVLPALLVPVADGSGPVLTARVLIVSGERLVRWVIVTRPHRERAVGPAFNRDGSP